MKTKLAEKIETLRLETDALAKGHLQITIRDGEYALIRYHQSGGEILAQGRAAFVAKNAAFYAGWRGWKTLID